MKKCKAGTGCTTTLPPAYGATPPYATVFTAHCRYYYTSFRSFCTGGKGNLFSHGGAVYGFTSVRGAFCCLAEPRRGSRIPPSQGELPLPAGRLGRGLRPGPAGESRLPVPVFGRRKVLENRCGPGKRRRPAGKKTPPRLCPPAAGDDFFVGRACRLSLPCERRRDIPSWTPGRFSAHTPYTWRVSACRRRS